VDEVSVGDGRVHGPRRERGQSNACLNHYHLDKQKREFRFCEMAGDFDLCEHLNAASNQVRADGEVSNL
jgi:hypothetical protein